MGIQLTQDWVLAHLPPRAADAHKGDFGTLSILAGSTKYRGAAVLAASGALRAGVGIVRVASIESVCAAVAASLPCCILHPMSAGSHGGISPKLLHVLLGEKQTAILAGCGLGNTEDTKKLILSLLRITSLSLVLDADALNVLPGHESTLDASRSKIIITPHIGEMSRLTGLSPEEILQDTQTVALEYAQNHSCVVVLKSHQTVVATPEGGLYLHTGQGNPGLAKGGSGDVLAGIIASLLAQGLDPAIAAGAGVWLHAQAGAKAIKQRGFTGLSPMELPDSLCEVWLELQR